MQIVDLAQKSLQNVEKRPKFIVELQKVRVFVDVEFWEKLSCRMQKFYIKTCRNVDFEGYCKCRFLLFSLVDYDILSQQLSYQFREEKLTF